MDSEVKRLAISRSSCSRSTYTNIRLCRKLLAKHPAAQKRETVTIDSRDSTTVVSCVIAVQVLYAYGRQRVVSDLR